MKPELVDLLEKVGGYYGVDKPIKRTKTLQRALKKRRVPKARRDEIVEETQARPERETMKKILTRYGLPLRSKHTLPRKYAPRERLYPKMSEIDRALEAAERDIGRPIPPAKKVRDTGAEQGVEPSRKSRLSLGDKRVKLPNVSEMVPKKIKRIPVTKISKPVTNLLLKYLAQGRITSEDIDAYVARWKDVDKRSQPTVPEVKKMFPRGKKGKGYGGMVGPEMFEEVGPSVEREIEVEPLDREALQRELEDEYITNLVAQLRHDPGNQMLRNRLRSFGFELD